METDRLEAFSDGVIAIAITLLVLEIKVPPENTALGAGLLRLWPSYLAYAVSFLVIGTIWINHHAMFRRIARTNDALLLLNTLQLLLIAFLPFPTAVLSQAFHRGAGQTVAAAFYGAVLTALGTSVVATWNYAARGHRLLDERTSPAQARQIGKHLLVGPLGYAVATVIALLSPSVAVLIFLSLNAYFLWPRPERNENG